MKNAIDIKTSLQTNYLSWIVILLSIVLVSHPFITSGFITFFSLLLAAYFIHKLSHDCINLFTILHHYHHAHDNFFSHFSQIILELLLGMIYIPLCYCLGNTYLDIWSVLLFTLFYSTIHNFNYGYLRVNNVHFLHHIDMYTNFGPDICDIAFHTKNPKNTDVENTQHYIPNIITITVLILILKHIFNNNHDLHDISGLIFYILLATFIAFVSTSSIYLYFFTTLNY